MAASAGDDEFAIIDAPVACGNIRKIAGTEFAIKPIIASVELVPDVVGIKGLARAL